jgi:malate synthase
MRTAAALRFQPVDEEANGGDTTPVGSGGSCDRRMGAGREQAAVITRVSFLDLVDTCVRHLAAWLDSAGHSDPPPADAANAVAENSRVQLWRWLHAGNAALEDGTPIDFALFDAAIQRVGERLPRRGVAGQGNVLRAACLLAELTYARTLADSMTRAAPTRGC